MAFESLQGMTRSNVSGQSYVYLLSSYGPRNNAWSQLLGPFHGAIAVPSVTRCRRCGYLFYIAIHQVSLLSHAACALAIAGFGSSW